MKWRRWLWLLLLAPILIGLARLRFDVEVLDLLPPGLPTVQGLKLYQQYFANARELIVAVRAPDAERAEVAARAIAEHLRLQTNVVAGAFWQPPWIEHPGQSAELIAYLWLNQPPEAFSDFARRLSPDNLPATLIETREGLATSMSPAEIARSSYDPFGFTRLPESMTGAAPDFAQGQEMFSSPDGAFRIVFVQANRDLTTYRDCAYWLQAVQKIVTETLSEVGRPAPARVAVGYTGRPAFVAEIAIGMERDITTSVGGTSIIIGLLFWLAHRRWKPMFWLLTLLALILAGTLALGGLIFGTISVISMGFAAILLGLAVDYAVVHYQEALAHPDLTVPEIRKAIAPSIFWAAVTSISAFLVLNFGGLPGLAQLGSLVGVGIALSACVMIFAFLPPLFPERRKRTNLPLHTGFTSPSPTLEESAGERTPRLAAPRKLTIATSMAFAATALVLLLSIAVLASGLPRMDSTANSLRPRHSESYAALEDVKTLLNEKREPLWLIVRGSTEAEVARRLEAVEPILANAISNNTIAGFKLPTPLWPRPEFQAANRPTAVALAARGSVLREAALTNGFAEPSLGLTEEILRVWRGAGEAPGVFWPTNPMSRWIFEKVVARNPTNYFALGFLNPIAETAARSTPTTTEGSGLQNEHILRPHGPSLTALESELPRGNVWLSGWELLGKGIFSSVHQNMWKLVVPMLGLILLSLCLAFRRPREVVLSLAVLMLSGLCLLTVMRFAGWSWNLLNLMALPLILGTGVDYSIFMQLALRRYQGDLALAYHSVGRALLLCGATAVAGFGSLAWSSNAGMASLGAVCAVGIAGNMLISVLLLPRWWKAFEAPGSNIQSPERLAARDTRATAAATISSPHGAKEISGPSVLYCSFVWRLGLWIVRLLPERACTNLSRPLANLYWRLAPLRREVVIRNILPVVKDSFAAQEAARKLFEQFALKLVDLWRFEAGLPIADLFGEYSGWQHFLDAQAQQRGILLVTAHLGNWEFGGPALQEQGVRLQVITLAEPGRNFTRLRLQSRARRDIETIVIGDDPFVFVDIIRRLEAGASIALLVDRPSPPTAVTVELFGRPFAASIAAAELARASGCVVLPVYMLRTERGYGAHILPPVPYLRAGLRDRQARQQLTQEIMRAFEPVIRDHPDQWFHFVPIWNELTVSPARDAGEIEHHQPSPELQ